MTISKKIQANKGVATLELLMAFAILVINITSVILIVNSGQSVYVDYQTNTEAVYKATEMVENTKASARKDFNLVNVIPPYADDIYTKEVLVEFVDLFTKKVTTNITWQTENSRAQKVSLSTLLTNPEALNGGNTCSSVLMGNWQNPSKTEYEFGADVLGDTSSGFPITHIEVFNHKMYVTVNNNNGNNDETFFVLDVTDPSVTPIVLGKLDNNGAVGPGLNAVAIDGKKYAYVANGYGSNFNTCSTGPGCSQLQVIDISDSTLPKLVKTYKIPGVTGTSGQSVGTSIFYKDGIVYLGLAKATGPELNIIDVGGGGTPFASPLNPIKIGGYEINNGVNSILVKDKYAYVASPNNSKELMTFDIADPAIPYLVGGFDAPNGGGNNGNGKSIYQVGDVLYFGRTLLTGDELYVLNNTDPLSTPTMLGSKNIQNGSSNTSVNGILVRDFLLFLTTNSEFQIWNASNPSNITEHATPLTLPPGAGGGLKGTASDCEGNYIYVGSQSSNEKGYISVITGS